MSDQVTASLVRIQQKLDRLRGLDGTLALFCARSHGYRLGPPLTDADLQSHERQLGVKIPSDYQRFLSQVGHGGAGPCYGLFTLDSKDPENLTAYGDLSKSFRWTEPFNPEQWEYPCDEEGVEWDDDGKFVGMFLPGALYLCNYGCALRFFPDCHWPMQGRGVSTIGKLMVRACTPRWTPRDSGLDSWHGMKDGWINPSLRSARSPLSNGVARQFAPVALAKVGRFRLSIRRSQQFSPSSPTAATLLRLRLSAR